MSAARSAILALAVLGGGIAPALAHFQELIPDRAVIEGSAPGPVTLDLTFTHPMAHGPVMPMGQPARVGVRVGDTTQDLKAALSERQSDGQQAYRLTHTPRTPGDYIYFVEPAPYWEPAEEKMIVHYTKVVVDAFGADEGWDTLVGFPVEIRPLTRPYGLYAGQVFTGVVLHNGQPVPHAPVEIEYRSEGKIKPPAEIFTTQVVHADANGTFSVGLPRAGWWGLAALIDGPTPMKNPRRQGRPRRIGRPPVGQHPGHAPLKEGAWGGLPPQPSLFPVPLPPSRSPLMHLADGILPLSVALPAAGLAGAGVVRGLVALTPERLPACALLGAVFFVASLIHVPIGPSSAHLILTGLLGMVLGWAAFPVVLVGLILQAVFFGFGGVLALGVNTLSMAVPAVLMGGLWRVLGPWAQTHGLSAGLGGLCGAGALLLSALLVAGALSLAGEAFWPAATLVLVGNAPVLVVEALVSAAAVALVGRVRPDLLHLQGATP
ncbi:cobalt transporter CbiM [Pararhodospirillum photometricum]|nr:cobalt transporter CbiM [Pararhodospirillum photometricum]